jgi:hypothetical protein
MILNVGKHYFLTLNYSKLVLEIYDFDWLFMKTALYGSADYCFAPSYFSEPVPFMGLLIMGPSILKY